MLALMSPFLYLVEGACTTRIPKGSESVHASQSACVCLVEGACWARIAERFESGTCTQSAYGAVFCGGTIACTRGI